MVTPVAEESPVKPCEEANGEEGADKPGSATQQQGGDPPSNVAEGGPEKDVVPVPSLHPKGPLHWETAQGALGHVKAKVEVCKDESVGKWLLRVDRWRQSFCCRVQTWCRD